MENKENIVEKVNKNAEILRKELEGLTDEGLHEFFVFFYKMNRQHGTMIFEDKFEEFLAAFDSNPFKYTEDKKFKKQLIDNIIKYSFDYMSLITAAVLIKKKFTVEEICQNYYSTVNAFDTYW